MSRRRAVRASLIALLAAPFASAQHGVSDGQWRHYHGDAGSTRYAALDQITAKNAASLEIAWRFKGDNFGPTPEFKNETTPLYVDGVLYFTVGFRRDVAAIDAGTAELLWTFRFDEGERGRTAPRRNSGRGVAYWSDEANDARVFVVSPGFQLIALDAATGRPVPDFGDGGVVDLKRAMDQEVALAERNLGSSSPAIVFEDTVIVGPAFAGSGRPESREHVPGHVTAWAVRT